MHKNNRLKESISAFFSRFVISFPLLLAQAGFHRFHNGLERLIFVFSVTGGAARWVCTGIRAEYQGESGEDPACDRDGDRNNGGMTDGKSESNHKESYGPAFKTRREPL